MFRPIFLLFGLLFLTGTATSQEKNYPKNPYAQTFNAAYAQHPEIPRGILEAVAYKMSRFRHLPDSIPASCTGMPRNIGVMGLIRNGKGVFRENLPMVANLSEYGEKAIASDPKAHIKAYAQAYAAIKDTLGIGTKKIEEQVPVLTLLSEIPYDSSKEFALSARLFDIFQHLDAPSFQRAYGLPDQRIPFDSIFGPTNHQLLKSEFIRIQRGRAQGKNGSRYQRGALRSPDYPPAIWDPAPSCNYSSRNGTPISHVAIHTMQGSYAGAIAWAKDCNSNVSFHYAIRSSDGQVTQLVYEADMAWHIKTENDHTIGIEHEGYINDPSWLTKDLYQSSAALCRDICSTGGYGIDPLRTHDGPACSGSSSSCLLGGCIRIKGHQHYPKQTHTDPGPYYDWERYYRLINPNPATTNFTASNGTFYDSGGSGGNYSNDEREVYTIAPPQSSYVELTVNSFHIEDGWDSLYVYDGGGIDDPLIGAYSGTNIPSTLQSSGDSISLEFRSDCQTTKSGWSISWDAAPIDTIAPTTTVDPITGWRTQDFNASFVDQDSGGSGLSERFYQSVHFNNGDWRGNHRNGFFNDAFGQKSIHPDWKKVTGNWSLQNGRLLQNDESVSNSNIHAALDQNLSDRYLYHWKGLIEGSGSNKRAGLHIFCNEPDSSQRGDSYFVWFRQDDQAVQLYKVSNNSWGSGPVVQTSYPFKAGTWYDLKLSYDRINGDFDVYINDSLCLEWKDPNPIDSGQAISFRNGNSIYRVDSMKVYRSRYPSEILSIGPDTSQDLRHQNPAPSQSAGMVRSLAQDSAGNLSAIAQEKVDVDWSSPQLPGIQDGIGTDIDTLYGDTLKADWEQAQDPNSGIQHYAYAVDSIPGDSGIIGWTNTADSSMAAYLPSPVAGAEYYTSVRVRNQAGLMAGDTTSDGVLYLRPASLEEHGPMGSVRLYPSPLGKGERLRLQIRSERPLEVRTAIYDSRGRLLLKKKLKLGSGKDIRSFGTQLSAGIHHLQIRGKEVENRTMRFVVR